MPCWPGAFTALFNKLLLNQLLGPMPHYTGDLSRSWLIFPLLILYLFDLGGAGFLGPDEPRYASIGREMARSHDLVTPRLDGQPWFEKPPLLYWMIAVGRVLRLPDEWAARLPIALTSLGFLFVFFQILMREFSARVALAATTILATSAGWLAFSLAAIPDLPMSAALDAAMLIALFDTRPARIHMDGSVDRIRVDRGYIAGALLGLAILAKGFVPVVLFAPLFLVARRKRLMMIAGCIVVAAPWYLLCWLRNGPAFWHEFFWKQQVLRYFTPLLEHVQPWWYYVPVILAGMFPWTPLAGLLLRRKTYDDVSVRFLIAWLAFALVFFSVARNKLPGYMLPLLPPLAIVLAVGLEKSGASLQWWLTASALMLAALPSVAHALPVALLVGIRKAPLVLTPGLPFVLAAALVWWLAWSGKPNLAMVAIGMAVVFAVAYLKGVAFPALDERVSVRAFWRAHSSQIVASCVGEEVRREWLYGLNYYADRALPECAASAAPGSNPRISTHDDALAIGPQIVRP